MTNTTGPTCILGSVNAKINKNLMPTRLNCKTFTQYLGSETKYVWLTTDVPPSLRHLRSWIFKDDLDSFAVYLPLEAKHTVDS